MTPSRAIPGEAHQAPPAAPAVAKRAMRAVWRCLPRTALSYKLAKVLTRTLLAPEATPLLVDVRVGGRFPLRVDLGDIVGNDVYCMDDHYEAPTFALWCRLAAGAATIVDLGSHVGLYACAAAAANPQARVIAVEAYARNLALLRRNAAAFPNLTPVATAIDVSSGERTFRLSPITGGGYVEGEASGSTPGIRDRSADTIRLDALALDDLCAQRSIDRIDLLKMDLEGLELPLLADQETFWTRHAPRHVLVEMTVGPITDGGPTPAFAAMARRGYRYRRLERLYTFPWWRREALANWYFWR